MKRMCCRMLVLFTLILWLVLAGAGVGLVSLLDPPVRGLPIWLVLGGAGVVGSLAIAVASVVLARRLARPVRELIDVAERISTGPTGQRIFLAANGDLAQLGQALNRLSERLAVRIGQLEEDRQQLRTILSGMVEGVVALDAEQRI